jgi:FKBP-type peptidyl-prolyl cis-trans isomerase SlyD
VHIDDGKRVRIKVKLTRATGEIIEESVAEYFHGAGTILPGLERALAGLGQGAKRSGVIPAAAAFDAVAQLPQKTIPRAEFPAGVTLAVGARFAARGPTGQDVSFEVLDLSDAGAQVRFVHPLAGQDIHYDAEVLDVTDPTPPPLPGDALPEE